MEHVHQKNVEKVSKWLEKGLDPNFHDSDSGGEHQHIFFMFPVLKLAIWWFKCSLIAVKFKYVES